MTLQDSRSFLAIFLISQLFSASSLMLQVRPYSNGKQQRVVCLIQSDVSLLFSYGCSATKLEDWEVHGRSLALR
jgi:hypothetical protein